MIDISKRRYPEIEFFSNWSKVINNIETDNTALLLSSVIHEVYSYGTSREVKEFWSNKETIPNYNDVKMIDKISKCIKISLGDINDIKAHDLITSYMLNSLKADLNIK